MGTQHVEPQQAVQVFQDMHAEEAIGIHWGTFEMTDEPLDEPPKKLAEATREAGLSDDAFTALRHGRLIQLDDPNDTRDACSRQAHALHCACAAPSDGTPRLSASTHSNSCERVRIRLNPVVHSTTSCYCRTHGFELCYAELRSYP
jgi:hypothetical protein